MATRSLRAIATLVAVLLFFGRAEASPSLGAWVTANTSQTEKTVCAHEERGEFFLIAIAGPSKVRLGSRVDMSGYGRTQEFGVAWVIGNETAEQIVAKVQPEPIKGRYFKDGPRVYADNLEYQFLNTPDSKLLRVTVHVHKCAVWSDESNTCKSGRKVYSVKVCDVKL